MAIKFSKTVQKDQDYRGHEGLLEGTCEISYQLLTASRSYRRTALLTDDRQVQTEIGDSEKQGVF